MCSVLLALLACICPPLAVCLHTGCDNNFWINLILTFLGFVPGAIHAWYIICCHEPAPAANIYIHQHSASL